MSRLWALSLALSLLLPMGALAAPVCKGANGYADAFNGRRTFLWRPDWLEANKARGARDPALAPAWKQLFAQADAALVGPTGPSENSFEVFSRAAWAYGDMEYRRAAAALANYHPTSEINLTIARQ